MFKYTSASMCFTLMDFNHTNSCSIQNETSDNFKESVHRIFALVIQYVLLIFIVVGNSSVLIWTLKSAHKSRLNRFFTNLAIADLFVGLGNLIPDIIWKTTVDFYGPTFVCKITKYLMNTSIMSSSYALLSLSIDRCIAIKWPFSRIYDQDLYTITLCGLGWLFALLFNIPSLIFFHISHSPQFGVQCSISWPPLYWKIYLVVMVVLIFFIPVLIIILTHAIIIRTIWKVKSSLPRNTIHTQGDCLSDLHNDEHKRSKLLHSDDGASYSRASGSHTEASNHFWHKAVSCGTGQMKTNGQECLSSNMHDDETASIRCHQSKPRSISLTKNNNNHSLFVRNQLDCNNVFSRAKMKSIQLTFLIVAVFIACWLPYMVWNFVITLGGIQRMELSLRYTSVVFNVSPCLILCLMTV
uniref:G-protein coupled receptors family 1 profile domain-containing protein n=1 Tax=Trichobilharzia regenti TaxID=157069 RepID=A0AA85JW55_TRIRE|nr:unnamed protein product [Trichobilharzia regenti]